MQFVLLGLLVLNVAAITASWRKKRPAGDEGAQFGALEISSAALATVDGLAIGFFTFLMCIFMPHGYLIICMIVAAVLLEVLIVGLLYRWWTKKRFLIWLACALAVGAVMGGSELYNWHMRSITMPESFDYRTFRPFKADSRVLRMEEEAALRFDDPTTVPRMDGATALYPVYAAAAQATYPKTTSEVQASIYVTCSTTAAAYRRIVDGRCDIIFVAGPSAEQEAYAAEKNVELVYTPIGREAFVFFVHPDNPVEGLTLDQIRGIYAGKVNRWDELGVRGLGKIRPYQRSPGSGSQTALERFVMRGTPLRTPETEEVAGSMGGIVQQVSEYKNQRNAIGYSFRFYCTALMPDFHVKLLAVNGAAPTVENIENGTYPLASVFYAVTRSDADENTRALVQWLLSPQGQEMIRRVGYTPINAGQETE